jgi:hypothetical protein
MLALTPVGTPGKESEAGRRGGGGLLELGVPHGRMQARGRSVSVDDIQAGRALRVGGVGAVVPPARRARTHRQSPRRSPRYHPGG